MSGDLLDRLLKVRFGMVHLGRHHSDHKLKKVTINKCARQYTDKTRLAESFEKWCLWLEVLWRVRGESGTRVGNRQEQVKNRSRQESGMDKGGVGNNGGRVRNRRRVECGTDQVTALRPSLHLAAHRC